MNLTKYKHLFILLSLLLLTVTGSLYILFLGQPVHAASLPTLVRASSPTVDNVYSHLLAPVSAGPEILLDATMLGLTERMTVTTWNGQPASGTPIFRTNQTPNGQPAVAFDGTDHMGETGLIPTGPDDDFVIVAVVKPDAIDSYHNLIDDQFFARPMLWIHPGNRYEFNFTPSTFLGTRPDGWDIVIADSAQGNLYVNSPANPATALAVSYPISKTFDLLNRNGGQTYQGLVAELRVYTDKDAFGNDFQALYDELYDKYISIGERPVNNLPGPQMVNEDNPLAINSLSVSDSDGNLATTQLTVTHGALSVMLMGTAVITDGVNGSNGLTIAGSQNDINGTLASLSYQGDLNFNGNDVLTIIATDDTMLSDTDTVAITVFPVNDPPVNSVPSAQTVDEDTPLSISTISVTDIDGNLASIQLSVFNGRLNVTLAGSATISAGSNGSGSLTISGSEADINATLTSLSYQGTLNFNGADVLTIVSTDSAGIPLSDTDTVAITVNPINNAPVNSVPSPQIAATGTPLVISTISVTDVDGNLATTQLSVMNGIINVSLAGGATISGGSNGSGSLTLSGTQTDINATLASLIYQSLLNFHGCDALAVMSTDSAGTPLSDTDTITIRVDPPALAIAPVVTLTNGGGAQAQLDWSPNAANCTYNVYRSTEPYDNYSLVATLPAGSSTYLADPEMIGNITTNYFYYVVGIADGATHSAVSNRNGAFGFALVPGE